MKQYLARMTGSVRRRADLVTYIVSSVLVLFYALSLGVLATDGHPMSALDEHVHYDTALKLHAGELSYRGAFYEEEVVTEWSCGVGHQAGPLVHGCNDPRLDVTDVTSGQYTTGYIHYPTYFAGGEVFRAIVQPFVGEMDPLSIYRLFSAFLMVMGVLATGVFAFVLGLRRAAFVAALTLPVAASNIVVMGVMVTPNSTALLSGALIAGTGLLWLRRGKGFIWLVLATLFASSNAVVSSLPAGGFLLLIAGIWIAHRIWGKREAFWEPKIWQFIVLAGAVLAPIIAWGRYVAATATVTNAEVYGPYQATGWRQLLGGALQELFVLHSPWTDWAGAMTSASSTISMALRGIATGIPMWITIMVFGVLVFSVLRRRAWSMADGLAKAGNERGLVSPLAVLAVTTLLTIVLYPPALRVSNAFSFGIDVSIVTRYSMAFAPALTLILLLIVRERPFAIALAALGVIGMVGTTSGWF